MSDFDEAISFVIRHEGGLNVNQNDRGGITNHGISLRYLRGLVTSDLVKYGIFETPSEETIKELTLAQAKNIYYGEFWLNAPFERIDNQEHANYIFDMAVNLGISPAIKCVQRACWAVMRRWDHLIDDGILGNKTIETIHRCGFMIMPAIRAERGNYYRNIVKNNPDQKEFLDGWYNRTYKT